MFDGVRQCLKQTDKTKTTRENKKTRTTRTRMQSDKSDRRGRKRKRRVNDDLYLFMMCLTCEKNIICQVMIHCDVKGITLKTMNY